MLFFPGKALLDASSQRSRVLEPSPQRPRATNLGCRERRRCALQYRRRRAVSSINGRSSKRQTLSAVRTSCGDMRPTRLLASGRSAPEKHIGKPDRLARNCDVTATVDASLVAGMQQDPIRMTAVARPAGREIGVPAPRPAGSAVATYRTAEARRRTGRPSIRFFAWSGDHPKAIAEPDYLFHEDDRLADAGFRSDLLDEEIGDVGTGDPSVPP